MGRTREGGEAVAPVGVPGGPGWAVRGLEA
jgi:hypothetical protein